MTRIGTVENKIRIGERDKWRCGICQEMIDKTLSIYESDWAATIDHIVPIAKGGKHNDENLQIAHWHCNRKKGKKITELKNKPPTIPKTLAEWEDWERSNKRAKRKVNR